MKMSTVSKLSGGLKFKQVRLHIFFWRSMLLTAIFLHFLLNSYLKNFFFKPIFSSRRLTLFLLDNILKIFFYRTIF